MLQNALDLAVPRPAEAPQTEDTPVWALSALSALAQKGMSLDAEAILTRETAAQLLYQAVQMHTASEYTQ